MTHQAKEVLGDGQTGQLAGEDYAQQVSFPVLRYLAEAEMQLQQQIVHQQHQLKVIGAVTSLVASLETDLADAKTVIRAMAEADQDQDGGGVQAIARTFLARSQ